MSYKASKEIDKEVFFLGCVMHDLGLAERFDGPDTFDLEGAKAAHNFCSGSGLAKERADLVHEMVALHNAVGTAHKLDPEIALLHYGAGADVAGLWIDDINPKTVNDIIERFPREGFKQGMTKLIQRQIERKPASYMSTMVNLGFLSKINAAPFFE